MAGIGIAVFTLWPRNTDHRMLNPKFPTVEGRYQMTAGWAVTLPGKFNRRLEDGSLVFWRPGITAWTNVWENNKRESREDRLKWISGDASADSFDAETHVDANVTRFAYRLTERREKAAVHAVHAFAIGQDGHVQMAIYFDNEDDLRIAKQLWNSLEETRPNP